MFNSLFKLATDVGKIAAAPVEIIVDVTRAVTKPVAEGAEELVKTVKELTK